MFHTNKGTPCRQLIEEHAMPVTETGCWLWDCEDECVEVSGEVTKADCAAWMAFRGPVPAGWRLVHDCHVDCCVNPSHMHLERRHCA